MNILENEFYEEKGGKNRKICIQCQLQPQFSTLIRLTATCGRHLHFLT